MTIDTDAILSVVSQLAGDRQLQATASGSLKGAAIAGLTTFMGGLAAGPIGLAAGASLGGLLAYADQRGRFKSVAEAINEMSDEQKQRVAIEVDQILRNLDITDLEELVKIAMVANAVVQAGDGRQAQLLQSFIRQSVSIVQRQLTT